MKYLIIVVCMLFLSGCYNSIIDGSNIVFYPDKDVTYLKAKIAIIKTKDMEYEAIRVLKICLKAEAIKYYNNQNYTYNDFENSLKNIKIKGYPENSSFNEDLNIFKKHILKEIKNMNNIYAAFYLNFISELL